PPAAEPHQPPASPPPPTPHPRTSGALTGSGPLGFPAPPQPPPHESPASLDADVYQVRRIPADPTSYDLLKDFVVWDCPDMTTWAAAGYIPRLIETAALADVLVYAASDERYNDEMPTQFLQMLLQTGKPVVVCLMKMRAADAPALVAHFNREVAPRMPPGIVGTLAIPFLKPDELLDPARKAARYRIPLLNQAAVLGGSPELTRRRTAWGAMRFLTQTQEQIL